MIRIPVSSSNVVSIGYDPSTQTLEVEFHNGNVYQYFDVPQGVHDALMSSGTAGQFLNSNIKGVYRYAKL